MKRLEIIHLRQTGKSPVDLARQVCRSIACEDGLAVIRIYTRVSVATDVAIHLQVDPDSSDPRAAELGVRLADAMKHYGMVEHSIWSEVAGPPAEPDMGECDEGRPV